jgi:hypothetical protein
MAEGRAGIDHRRSGETGHLAGVWIATDRLSRELALALQLVRP